MSGIYTYSLQHTSTLTRLHPVTVLVALMCFIVMVFSTLNMIVSLSLMAFVLLIIFAGRLPLKQTIGVLLLVTPLVIFITLIQGLAQPGHPLWIINAGPIHAAFSREGAILGLAVTFRVVLLALGMTIFFTIVHPVRLARALTEMGVPFRYAYTLVIALRFLPLILTEVETIKNAQKARGYDIDRANFVVRGLKVFPLMIPLIITALRRASTIALAMDLRAFGAFADRTWLVEVQPPGLIDKAIRIGSVIAAVVFVTAAVMK